MNQETALFESERPRLVRIAERVLGDASEAEDIVQSAWIKMQGNESDIENLPGWLTTVTTRLCLDRLRSRRAVPEAEVDTGATSPDPADEVALADTVGVALQMVLDRLTPSERVAFVLHDTFGVEFPTIAEILGATPAAARKLASRARAKIAVPADENHGADHEVVDAFLAAARNGEFERLLGVLAPDVVVCGDSFAVAMGTPERIDGRHEVATFFNGAASAALPVYVGERPGLAWYNRGQAMVAFDFTVVEGRVQSITFRAAPEVLADVRRRKP